MDGKKFAGQAAHRTYLDGAFGVRIALVVNSGAHTLACEAAKAFIHII